MNEHVVGIDIGGTFTDLVAWDGTSFRMAKTPSTPPDYAAGVLNGLDELFPDWGLRSVAFIVHGTTVGLNAFLERRGGVTALLTTEGFQDVYEIGRMNRLDMYNLHFRRPERLVPRYRIYQVHERIMADGTVRTPLDSDRLSKVIESLEEDEAAAVAVCLIHGYANPIHEEQVEQTLLDQLPGVSVAASHKVAPEWREYERTSTTVINAYIMPIMERYLTALEEGLAQRYFEGHLFIMQSNGGVMTAARARQLAVRTLMSGPVGGTLGSEVLAHRRDEGNLICADMGGTSFDVSLVLGGASEVSTQSYLEGFPVLAPMVDIHSIGAGGGSIARAVDGGLRVGPISAGADPGPACYGRGGTEPTVTDANLALGRIDPDYFVGGAMKLDRIAAERALAQLADTLGLDIPQLAEGILRVVNAKMANAIRTITVSRGIDPRGFGLVAFGGAGPMHAAFLAEELTIPFVIVPPSPGTFSAWGMLHTDIRHDLNRSYFKVIRELEAEEIERVYQILEGEGREILGAEGVRSEDQVRFVRTADIRYVGQEYFLNVPMPAPFGSVALNRLPDQFHEAYRQRYGHSTPSEELEIVNLRLRAVGRFRDSEAALSANQAAPTQLPATERSVFFEGNWRSWPVFRRSSMCPGFVFGGPAIVEEPSCTTVVPPSFNGEIDQFHNLILTRGQEEAL